MPYIVNCCSNISIISNISFITEFSWNILSNISIEKLFEWEVGEGPLYWYRIESCASDSCPSTSYNYTEIRTIAATSLENLCQRLYQIGFNRRIKSIKKWTKPALICDISNIEECNNLEDIDLNTFNCSNIITGCSSSAMAYEIIDVDTKINELNME